jgi:hypothetical protein
VTVFWTAEITGLYHSNLANTFLLLIVLCVCEINQMV